MITKKINRFFGLFPERSIPERPAPEHAIPERVFPEQSMPEPAVLDPAPIQSQVEHDDASGPLMRALYLTSHAGESPMTEQEKRMAWELPTRMAETDEVLVPRSVSKGRMLRPALEQMRETQAALLSGYAAAVEEEVTPAAVPEMPIAARNMENPEPVTTRWQLAVGEQTREQVAHQEQILAVAALQPDQGQEKQEPTPPQPAPAAVDGWQYSVMLQRAEPPVSSFAAEPGPTATTTSEASSISSMFQRLRSHSEKPPTSPAAVPKAPGFLSKLWAK